MAYPNNVQNTRKRTPRSAPHRQIEIEVVIEPPERARPIGHAPLFARDTLGSARLNGILYPTEAPEQHVETTLVILSKVLYPIPIDGFVVRLRNHT